MNIYWHSNESMSEVPDESVQLVLMSPPQPAQYDADYLTQYYQYNSEVLKDVYKKLKPKGYLCFVTTDNYHNGKLLLRHARFLATILDAGFNVFSMKIWSRGDFVELYRPSFSYVVMASKERTKTLETVKKMHKAPFGYDVWKITEDYKLWKQYSAFPIEIARRCIECFSDPGDSVLDPYMGTGTTPIVAEALDRLGIGYEIDEKIKYAFEERLGEIKVIKSETQKYLGLG